MPELRRIAGAAGLSAVTALGGVAWGVPAGADPYGTNAEDTGAFPDSNPHTYCLGASLSSSATDEWIAHMNYLEAATDINSSGPSDCTGSTDVIGQNVNLPGAQMGLTDCIEFAGFVCDRSRAQIDESYIAQQRYPITTRRKTICHEVGHTVGLTHYKDADRDYPSPAENQHDCMISGTLPSPDDVWKAYSTHHKSHINDNF